MSYTVLMDLDDTLLVNEMGVHMPAYLSSLQNHLSTLVPRETFLPEFLRVAQVMFTGERPARSLEDVFYDEFCAATGNDRETLAEIINQYYRSVYDDLKITTEVKPGSQALVGELARRGYSLVVATNPLFPRSAVEQRILWAELPISPADFRLITSCEYFHFAKPNPAYYAEILGYLGWPEGPVVMIGNDPLNDIQAAEKLGLKTYHVTDGSESAVVGGAGGAMSEVATWLDASPQEYFQPDFRSAEAILAVYKSTLAVLDTYVRHCGEAEWKYRPGEEWTSAEVLYHLGDVEEKVYLPRVRSLVQETNPFIPGVDTDAWYVDGFPPLATPRAMLDRFFETRLQTISLLADLAPEEWQRPARHAIFGPTTIREIAYIMARHDQLHIRQLGQVLSIR